MMKLSDLSPGETGVVEALNAVEGTGRLWELGLLPGTEVTCLRRAPAGDPTAYEFKGVVLALRQGSASEIRLRGGGVHGR